MANLGKISYDNLIAGDYPLKAVGIVIHGPAQFKRGDVVGISSIDGSYSLVDSAKSDGTEKPVGVICDDTVAEDGAAAAAAIYVKGEFSSRYLNFGGVDTAETHKQHMAEAGMLIRDTKI